MRVRIKICGITNTADAESAVRLGADALGLNFYSGSPRCISHHIAAEIAAHLPPFVEPVGLFVKQPMAEVLQQAAQATWLRTIQWHGELPALADAGNYRFIVAVQIRDAGTLRDTEYYLERCRQARCVPAAVLVDAHAADKLGGTGMTAPWDLLRDFRPGIPVILAGGLTPDNVAEAIRTVRPFAVDVASGVESSPGRKDTEKMRRFIEVVRSA